MSELQFTVPSEQSGKRIDSWLAEQIEGLTRSAAQNLLSGQAVSCNGQPLKKNYKLVGGEAVTVQLPELKEVDLKPENIPLDIVYEDAYCSGQQATRHGCASGGRQLGRHVGKCIDVPLW